MKLKLDYLLVLVVVFIFTSCSDTQIKETEASNVISSTEEPFVTAFVESADSISIDNRTTSSPTDLHRLYLEYDMKITESLKRYNNEKSEYLIKEDDIFGRSTDGGHIVKKYKEHIFVAYQSKLMGEMGKRNIISTALTTIYI